MNFSNIGETRIYVLLEMKGVISLKNVHKFLWNGLPWLCSYFTSPAVWEHFLEGVSRCTKISLMKIFSKGCNCGGGGKVTKQPR